MGAKKSRWRVERHRLEDGIPKEEEEKPRKRILYQRMLRCNTEGRDKREKCTIFPSYFLIPIITKSVFVRCINMI